MPNEPVTTIANNQADLIWVQPGEDIRVLSFSVHTCISDLYMIKIQVSCGSDELDPVDFLNQQADLVVRCGEDMDEQRHFSGIVTRFSQGPSRHGTRTGGTYLYDIEVRPALWRLSRRYTSRVFCRQNAREIISEILDYHDVAATWDLDETPPTRDHCVQYSETDFNFISRLLEDEGIHYYFNHEEGTVIFSDATSDYPPCVPQHEATYDEERGPHVQDGHNQYIRHMVYEQEVGAGLFTQQHYNYETPNTNLTADMDEDQAPHNTSFEIYQHTQNFPDLDRGTVKANTRRQAEMSAVRVASGTTSCRFMEPGHLFTMDGHFRDDMNTDWLITSVRIFAEQGLFECQFTAIPADIPFRPECRTPKPRVYGMQTAVVTGPPGNEIYVDELGRCKLQFHWDREGRRDDRSSLWVRVANGYAGRNYGIQWIPRVGHEVLVSFIDGDPDQPVVAGRVYNDHQRPPLGPGERHQNIIKSARDNHILFDDFEDRERLNIRAQRNMNTLVNADSVTSIGNSCTETIGNGLAVTVEEGDYRFEASAGAMIMKSAQRAHIASDKISLSADTEIVLQVGGNAIKITQSGVEISGQQISSTADGAHEIRGAVVRIN